MSGGDPGFGARLRAYRERAGLTQEALAERAGLAATAIAALERGRRQHPYPYTVQRLAEALALGDAERAAFGVLPAVPPSGGNGASTATPSEPQTNLPAPRSSLVGRERDVAALVALIPVYEGRLVTLTGIGGGGKTRLALAVAAALRTTFPDGVRLVELASLADPALVQHALAAALDVPEVAGVPLVETLVQALGTRSLLLVLDNCEHLIESCAALVERLLAGCPNLRILATSREQLQLAGERRWRVLPLAAPDAADPTERAEPLTPDEAAQFPAVQLFVERARAVDAGFVLTPENAGVVSQVCARLDGIPLAIELAAARVRVLALPQIRDRLDDSMRLLTGNGRAAPTRQQTLRATLDWSYDLLTPPEQTLFRRLAVFAGGCEIDAAEGVCADAELDAADVLDLLSELVDKSLVLVAEVEGVARYRLLEPVRQYAATRAARAESSTVAACHADWYLALAERAVRERHRPQQLAWEVRLEQELGNLRAALRWAAAEGEIETEARLAVALAPFLQGRTYLSEGRRALEPVLARSAAALDPALRRRALLAAGQLAQWQADMTAAGGLLSACLTDARAADDRAVLTEALAYLGLVQSRLGAVDEAVELLKESEALARDLGDSHAIALPVMILGVTRLEQGDFRSAQALLEEALCRYQERGDVRYVAVVHTELGCVARGLGDLELAARLLRQGLAVHLATGDRTFIGISIRQIAAVLADLSPERAARLLGAAEAFRELLGVAHPPSDQANDDRTIAAIRTRISAAQLAAAWAEGRVLSIDQAVAEATAGVETPAPAPAESPALGGGYEPLTPREREVARLLTQGYTDRQIAAALAIAASTVGVHVHHILDKLGLRSRWQLADPAAAHGSGESRRQLEAR